MVASIRKVIGESYLGYGETARNMWVLEWPGQTVVCVSSIYWTAEVTDAMKKPAGVEVISRGSLDSADRAPNQPAELPTVAIHSMVFPMSPSVARTLETFPYITPKNGCQPRRRERSKLFRNTASPAGGAC